MHSPELRLLLGTLRLVALTGHPRSPRVGLVDTVREETYRLQEGESRNGIRVVDVDYDADRVRLRESGFEYWLDMNGDSKPATSP